MSEETKKAVGVICEKIAKSETLQKAVEIAVEMHKAGAVADVMEETKHETR